jgi:lipopolysaccharide export system protein LptA
MRLIGLTLFLLASTFGARADSLEERVAALEARVRALEAAQSGGSAAGVDGTYQATLPNGKPLTATFDKGKVVVLDGSETKTATYTVAGGKVFVTAEGKTESMTIEGNVLRTEDSQKIVFTKVGAGNHVGNIDGSYQATMPDGKSISLDLAEGKAVVHMDTETKSGTYEIVGDRAVITVDHKPESFGIEPGHLKASDGTHSIDFVKNK